MAAGQLAGADGKAWIAAAAVAYEVQCRLCDAASIRARGWDHTTYGSISATLAAAMLLKLTHEQTVHALGIAGTTGTALRLTRAGELSMWKGCAFAFASRNGVFAALLAADGMTGPAPLFEGEMGFFQQVSGPFTLAKLGGPSAGDWMLPKTSIKFVPAEYHSQSAIAAAFELRRQIGDPKRIREIEIATFRTAVEIIGKDPEKWRPQTRETADHSLPYCTAVALVDGKVTAEPVHPRAAARPRPARPGRAHSRRRRPQAHRRLSRGHPEPRDGHARRRHESSSPRSHSRPATTTTRSRTSSSPSSSTAWSTRSSGRDRADQILDARLALEDDKAPHETLELTAKSPVGPRSASQRPSWTLRVPYRCRARSPQFTASDAVLSAEACCRSPPVEPVLLLPSSTSSRTILAIRS